MLNKTDKGRHELQRGQRSLGQRERAVLLMADGRQATPMLHMLFGGLGAPIVQNLLANGYIAEDTPDAWAASPRTPPKAERGSCDTFSGPRSLASARLFLFDLNERLFRARHQPTAERFLTALREARDAPAMLAVSQDILMAVEERAGADRADAIRERLA